MPGDPSILQAETGETIEVQPDAGDDDNTYQTGGFSYSSALGRVDTAIAQIQSTSQSAKVTSIVNNNTVVVQVFSQGSGVAGEEGQEVADGLNIADSIHLTAYRL